MGLLRRLLEGKAVKDGVRGNALVLACHLPTSNARNSQITARMRVMVPGREPYEVEKSVLAARLKSPVPGWTLPVLVDREEPDHVQVIWDEVPERSREEIQRAVDELLDAGRLRFDNWQADMAEREARNLFDDSSDSSIPAVAELIDPPGEAAERPT
jgi:hypothetical protein